MSHDTDRPGAPNPPLVVSIAMGYGHLRAARPLAEQLGTRVLHADGPTLADPAEARLWDRARNLYESISRLAQRPVLRAPFGRLLESVTHIEPLHPRRDLSRPTAAVRVLDRAIARGMGKGLAAAMLREDRPLLAPFYAPALAADRHLPRARGEGPGRADESPGGADESGVPVEGHPPEPGGIPRIWCLVTDADLNRVWVAPDPGASRIHYLAPAPRVVRRLKAYGVPRERIHLTGFPLPHSLLGGPDLPVLRRTLAARLLRLDRGSRFLDSHAAEIEEHLGPLPHTGAAPAPPRLVFAVGGSGTQADYPRRFLPSLAPLVREDRLRVTLVAGIRPRVAQTLRAAARQADLPVSDEAIPGSVELLHEPELPLYFARFDELMARTDILWTKPSEISFLAALGLPLLLAPAVGAHEVYNARWVSEAGAGLLSREPELAGGWIREWLEDGTLAAAAWSGFRRLPATGLYRILETMGAAPGSGAGVADDPPLAREDDPGAGDVPGHDGASGSDHLPDGHGDHHHAHGDLHRR